MTSVFEWFREQAKQGHWVLESDEELAFVTALQAKAVRGSARLLLESLTDEERRLFSRLRGLGLIEQHRIQTFTWVDVAISGAFVTRSVVTHAVVTREFLARARELWDLGLGSAEVRLQLSEEFDITERHCQSLLRGAGLALIARRPGFRAFSPRNRAVVAANNDGFSQAAIARRFGITRERVRQILLKARARGLTVKDARAVRDNQRVVELKRRLALARPCRVCGCWALRRKNAITCSPECARLYRIAGYQLDPKRRQSHRMATARGILRSEASRGFGRDVAWAKQVLAGARPANRAWVKSNSETERAVRRALELRGGEVSR